MLQLINDDWKHTLTQWFDARFLEQGVIHRRPLKIALPLTDEMKACIDTALARLQANEALAMPDPEYTEQLEGLDFIFAATPPSFDTLLPGALALVPTGANTESVSDGWTPFGPHYFQHVKPHTYDFARARAEWAAPVFTSIGHFDTAKLLAETTDAQIKETMERCEHYRYDGFDNFENKWREAEKLDTTHGKVVIDFGCGMGVEALQYARNGNKVILADIAEANVMYARKSLEVCGFGDSVLQSVVVDGAYPFWQSEKFDVFHACGVLHHTPDAGTILKRAAELLTPGGECRCMMYSDHLFGHANRDPDVDVTTQPGFMGYVRGRDGVGQHADWYGREKMERLLERAETGLEVESEMYACRGSYVCFILRKSS